MRTNIIVIVIAAASMLTGCDLVVSSLQTTGAPSINSDGAVEVPVSVVVRNQGTLPVGRFKISAQYTGGAIDPSRKFVVHFDDGSGSWYPWVSGLPAGGAVGVAGTLTFHPSEHGVSVSLTALADSCSGDEFMPVYCRVRESDESNNESAPIVVTLP